MPSTVRTRASSCKHIASTRDVGSVTPGGSTIHDPYCPDQRSGTPAARAPADLRAALTRGSGRGDAPASRRLTRVGSGAGTEWAHTARVSGPVDTVDAPVVDACGAPGAPCVEIG